MKPKFNLIILSMMIPLLMTSCNTVKKHNSNASIIVQMYEKWEGKWVQNMRFEQMVYYYKGDSIVKQEVWQEILSSPQKLHIRFNGFESGSGMLFANDSIFSFKDFQVVKEGKMVHHLLLLGFDLYNQDPAITESKLAELGFDINKSHLIKEEGREILVVGTEEEGDYTSSQFWIDKENLYLTRVISNRDNSISDVIFGNYTTIEEYPVATEMTFKVNGQISMVEKYFNISFPKELDLGLFDSKRFREAIW